MWALWWMTHSVVGGTGRVAFDVTFPYVVAPADISGLLAVGTMTTVLGKVVSGPICTGLGAYRVGLIALAGSAVLLLGTGLGGPSPLIPLALAWPAFRFIQTITWPSANTVCVAWFDRREHGSAWGIMSTASRAGIIAATTMISLSGVDLASRVVFVVVGVAMALYGIVIACAFRERPISAANAPGISAVAATKPVKPAKETAKGGGAKTTAGEADPSFRSELRQAATNPCLWLAMLAQGTATPLAEFQSVLPLLLRDDASLGPSGIAAGVTCWHLGILISVIACGLLLDRMSSMLSRIALVPLTLVTATLFILAADAGTGADSPLFAGPRKLPLAFTLGACAAPAIYLVSATTVTRHADISLAPTLSALCDMAGYTGNVLLLMLGPRGDEGVAGPSMLRATGYVACANAVLVTALYVLEARHQRPAIQKAQLSEPLLQQ